MAFSMRSTTGVVQEGVISSGLPIRGPYPPSEATAKNRQPHDAVGYRV
jgi:hypothetical protein